MAHTVALSLKNHIIGNGTSALCTRSQHNFSWSMNSKNMLLCSLVVWLTLRLHFLFGGLCI